MRYEIRIGWRYLYSGQQERSMFGGGAVAAAIALVGLAIMLATGSPYGVLMLVLGMISATVFALLGVFSVFTSVSVFGVVLGVAALTIVLAVTTGFQQQFRDKVLGVNAHVIVMKAASTFAEYRDVMDTAMRVDPDVIATQPFNFAEMLATRGKGELSGVEVKGIDPKLVRGVLDLESHMIAGSIDSLATPGAIIIGKGLGLKLHAVVGDEISLVMVDRDDLKSLVAPRTKKFRITGMFYSGFDEYDRRLVYTSLRATQDMFGRGDQVMGVELKIKDVDRADQIRDRLEATLGSPYSVQSWYDLNHNLFTALNFQKLALVIILTLIVIVATVNMVSALTMMVTDKTREIAILKSMGSTSGGVARIFLTFGLAIGSLGTLFGVAIGLATCYAVGAYGYHLDPKVYLIDSLPIDVRGFEVALVAAISVAISLVATLFPSQGAAALTPVAGLRYD